MVQAIGLESDTKPYTKIKDGTDVSINGISPGGCGFELRLGHNFLTKNSVSRMYNAQDFFALK